MEHSLKSSLNQRMVSFSPEIEALRGIAAITVLLGHLYLIIILPSFLPTYSMNPPKSNFLNVLLGGLGDPQPAVLLFFTISGLVLGRQLRKESITSLVDFLAYLVRRIFRLIPLMWFTTIMAYFLTTLVREVSLKSLYHNLLLKDISLNLPLWSLKVELCCSFFFPFIFLIFQFGGKLYNALLFVTLLLLTYFYREPVFLQYLVFFHAGLIVERISINAPNILSRSHALFLLIVAIIVMQFSPQFGFGPRQWVGYNNWHTWMFPEIFACSFILLFINAWSNSYVHGFLNLPFIRFLGKISFSIYLIHLPILYLLIAKYPIALNLTSLFSFLIIYFSLVIVIAAFMFHWIEKPSNKLGRKLGNFILNLKQQGGVLLPR
ncbi:acyltransferase family protein [Legionella sp. D16C41]|uniref:acyltransferase family protein n=1 Tax=Legionella sp. D16C41 TaxID=3402688 RepID=UPI003AF82E71